MTVVIAVWDDYVGPGLDEALRSVRSQGPRVEIVLVDNASRITVPETNGARVIRTGVRLTIGAARNAGLAAVRTPYALVWDADDVMLPETLNVLRASMARDPGLVACSPSIIDGRTGDRHHWPRRSTFALSRTPRVFALLNAVSSLYPTAGALIRTDHAQAMGFANADGGDDWVLGVSLALRGRVRIEAHLGRLYRRSEDSTSSGWRTFPHIAAHAALVRQRLKDDPATPRWIRVALPAIWLGQHLVLLVLRPLARLTPERRREAI